MRFDYLFFSALLRFLRELRVVKGCEGYGGIRKNRGDRRGCGERGDKKLTC